MATNPEDIRLTDDYRQRLAKLADQQGTTWQTLLDEAVEHIEQTQRKSDEIELVDIAAEYRELFGHAIEEKPVSRERIEQIAAKCSGSFSQDIIDDREDRL
jgi:predicted DNA-binding protein